MAEPLSLDALLDVTASERLFDTAIEIGKQIKQAIRRELGLIASAGVASKRFFKIADDLEKSDALVAVALGKMVVFSIGCRLKRSF